MTPAEASGLPTSTLSAPTLPAPESAADREPTPHVLVIAEEWDEDGDCLELVHPEGCPTVQAWSGVDQYDCPVAHEVYSCGLEMFFLHRDDPEEGACAERLHPGRYEIEVWSERHPGGPWGPEEWSGGLRTVEPAATREQT